MSSTRKITRLLAAITISLPFDAAAALAAEYGSKKLAGSDEYDERHVAGLVAFFVTLVAATTLIYLALQKILGGNRNNYQAILQVDPESLTPSRVGESASGPLAIPGVLKASKERERRMAENLTPTTWGGEAWLQQVTKNSREAENKSKGNSQTDDNQEEKRCGL